MRGKEQILAILGVSRGFATQQRGCQAFQKFKLVMVEHLEKNRLKIPTFSITY